MSSELPFTFFLTAAVDKEIIDDKVCSLMEFKTHKKHTYPLPLSQIVDRIVRSAPARKKGSDHLFKDMWNESRSGGGGGAGEREGWTKVTYLFSSSLGLLSYGDYLFLLTALISKLQTTITVKEYNIPL